MDRSLLGSLLQLCSSELAEPDVSCRLVQVLSRRFCCAEQPPGDAGGAGGGGSGGGSGPAFLFLSGILSGPESRYCTAGDSSGSGGSSGSSEQLPLTWQWQRGMADVVLGCLLPGATPPSGLPGAALTAQGGSSASPSYVLGLLGAPLLASLGVGAGEAGAGVDVDAGAASSVAAGSSDVQSCLRRYSLVRLASLSAAEAGVSLATADAGLAHAEQAGGAALSCPAGGGGGSGNPGG